MNKTDSITHPEGADSDTPIGKILQRMFPKGMLNDSASDTLARCMASQQWLTNIFLWKIKSIPVDGIMLSTVSTLGTAGRSRWFLMECGAIYLVIKISPAKNNGSTHLEVVSCVGGAVTAREKFEWQQHFAKNVAKLNSMP